MFLCIFGCQVFLIDQFCIVFVGDLWENCIVEELVLLFVEYGKILWDMGKYVFFVVLFDILEDLVEYYLIEVYEELFWSFLNRLSYQDEKEWLEDILVDFEYYKWEFCFDGELYFILCVILGYEVRKSWSFFYFMIVFQLRWVFDDLNGLIVFGQNMSRLI